jgi:CBS domain-containing protein
MHVKEIMQRPVVACPIDAALNDVARLMWEHDLGSIPIVDADGRLSGIVTDRDVCMAAYTQGRPLSEIPVSSAMSSNVLCCHIDDVVETAEQLMREGQVRRLPVIDNDGRPIGVLAVNDLARLAASARRTGIDRDLIQTLAAICTPRFDAGQPRTEQLQGPAAFA